MLFASPRHPLAGGACLKLAQLVDAQPLGQYIDAGRCIGNPRHEDVRKIPTALRTRRADALNFGYSDSTWWLRFTLADVPSRASRCRDPLSQPDHVDVYGAARRGRDDHARRGGHALVWGAMCTTAAMCSGWTFPRTASVRSSAHVSESVTVPAWL